MAMQSVGYEVVAVAALPDVPRPVLVWDRRAHHWLCLRDSGDARDPRWELVDSQRGICVLEPPAASAWLQAKFGEGAVAFQLLSLE